MAKFYTDFREEYRNGLTSSSSLWTNAKVVAGRTTAVVASAGNRQKLLIDAGVNNGQSLVGFKQGKNLNYTNTIETLVRISVDTATQVPGSFGIINHKYNAAGQGLSVAFLPASSVKSILLYDDKNGLTVNFANYNWASGTAYWVRYRQENTQHYVKVWPDGSAEPTSWTFTATYDVGTITGDTWAGIGTYTANHVISYYDYALATNGETAVAEYPVTGNYPNGYKYRKPITIDHTKVSTFSGFFQTLLLHTDTDLKSVANGGKVENSPLIDIRFENAAGIKLPHEIVSYSPTTGAIEAWVRLGEDTTAASLSTTVDTSFYVYFGKTLVAESIYGIPAGYASGLIAFERNWDGAGNNENQGEITPFITSSITSPAGAAITQPNGLFIGGDESGTLVSGYIMYTAATTQSRFGTSGIFNDHLVLVSWNGTNWQADLNGTPFVTFTPVSTDFLVAAVSWGNTVGSGRAINYASPLRAGEELMWGAWAVTWTDDINEVGNATRAVFHLNEPPAGTWVQNVASSDRFSLNMSGSGMSSGDAVAGKVGQALSFNGTSKKLRAKADVIWSSLGAGYMSAWVRPANLTTNMAVFSRRSSTSSSDQLTMFILAGAIRLDNGTFQWSTGYSLPAANQWYHIVWIANGTQQKLMVNGVVRATRTTSDVFNTATGYPRVQLGASITDVSTDGNWFNGQIDEFVLSTANYEDGHHVTAYNNQNSPSTFYSLGTLEQAIVINTIPQTGNARVQRVESIAQTGNARIRRTESISQAGQARIRRTEQANQTGNARIRRTESAVQVGNSRIERTSSLDQLGNAAIESFYFTSDVVQTGNARIERVGSTQQLGNAHIEKILSLDQSGNAFIEQQKQLDQAGDARIARIESIGQSGNAYIRRIDSIEQIGSAFIEKQPTVAQTGNARIEVSGNTVAQLGNAYIRRIDQLAQIGSAVIERVEALIIVGSAIISNPIPDKRPQTWEDSDTREPADWSADDKAPATWDKVNESQPAEWKKGDESQPQRWSNNDNKKPADWSPIYYD